LSVTKAGDGKSVCGEVFLSKSLGYGDYIWVVETSPSAVRRAGRGGEGAGGEGDEGGEREGGMGSGEGRGAGERKGGERVKWERDREPKLGCERCRVGCVDAERGSLKGQEMEGG
jgi:hypothetical protein